MRHKTLTRIIIATLLCTFLTFTVGKVTRVSALAVGPLADPVYDTEIFAFKDYVEQNLDAQQLDIMFFLIGGLAVAQMGAQDAMLISPYPNEESVKEWIINCGIQLYNSVIGLVPEGDYYIGIPSIGTSGVQGVPREVIKGLVAQMMGDAVVAINYPDLDTFLEDNPDQILLPFTPDLQLGLNAVFGLNGGVVNWQNNVSEFSSDLVWNTTFMSSNTQASYFNFQTTLNPVVRLNDTWYTQYGSMITGNNIFSNYRNLFINTETQKIYLAKNDGTLYYSDRLSSVLRGYVAFDVFYSGNANMDLQSNISYSASLYPDVKNLIKAFLNNSFVPQAYYGQYQIFYEDFIVHYYAGTSWDNKVEIFNSTDLNLLEANNNYYNQLQKDYLFDLRGLMGDLVNYVYTNPIWDNIYDIVGDLVSPDIVKVSVDLTPITDLLAPPIPVNMNDIALYTENDYLEKLKEHAKNYGDTLGEYFVFWHNSDPELVYVMFGSFIVILLGLFVGTWRHS